MSDTRRGYTLDGLLPYLILAEVTCLCCLVLQSAGYRETRLAMRLTDLQLRRAWLRTLALLHAFGPALVVGALEALKFLMDLPDRLYARSHLLGILYPPFALLSLIYLLNLLGWLFRR